MQSNRKYRDAIRKAISKIESIENDLAFILQKHQEFDRQIQRKQLAQEGMVERMTELRQQLSVAQTEKKELERERRMLVPEARRLVMVK